MRRHREHSKWKASGADQDKNPRVESERQGIVGYLRGGGKGGPEPSPKAGNWCVCLPVIPCPREQPPLLPPWPPFNLAPLPVSVSVVGCVICM